MSVPFDDSYSRLFGSDSVRKLLESSPAMKKLSAMNQTQAMLSSQAFEIAAANSLAPTLAEQFQGASYLDWQGAVSGLLEMASACRTLLDEIPFGGHQATLSGLYDSLRLIQDRSPYIMPSEHAVVLNGEPFDKAAEAIEASLPFLPEDVRESVEEAVPTSEEQTESKASLDSVLKWITLIIMLIQLVIPIWLDHRDQQRENERAEFDRQYIAALSSLGGAVQELNDHLDALQNEDVEPDLSAEQRSDCIEPLQNVLMEVDDAVDAFKDLDVPDRQAGDQEQEQ